MSYLLEIEGKLPKMQEHWKHHSTKKMAKDLEKELLRTTSPTEAGLMISHRRKSSGNLAGTFVNWEKAQQAKKKKKKATTGQNWL